MIHYLVPHYILEKHQQGESSGQINAVGLFVDISGFSTITDALMSHGPYGAELLTDVMGAIFGPMVETIYQQGGFICGFAGDAFTALFPLDAADASQSYRAVAAAWQIREQMLATPSYSTPYGSFEFKAKIGVALGTATWGIVAGESAGKHSYYFLGSAIDECAAAEHHASSGDLILNHALRRRMGGKITSRPAVPDGSFLIVDRLNDQLPQPQPNPDLAATQDLLSDFFSPELITQSIPGEFRQTINMFISLSGIETHQQMADFMAPVFRLQEQYGGFFNRVDFGDKGCYLLIFWGAPRALENDVERALNFILALQEVSTQPFSAGISYRISHAGFMGSDLRQEYTCYGSGVILAARQMTATPQGAIWLDGEMARKAEGKYDLSYVDDLSFKGFGEPQPVFSLRKRRDVGEAPLFQGRMVGRQSEIDRLKAAVVPIFHGRNGGAVYIHGEPGIGKSRLLHEFRDSLAAGRAVTWCRCPADEILRQSLNPFRYWLRGYFHQAPEQTEAESKARFTHKLDTLLAKIPEPGIIQELDRLRSVLGELVGLHWPDSLYQRLDPQLRFENSLIAIKSLIKGESLVRPVIIELEDAHWLDSGSAQLLAQLSHNVQNFPFMFLISSRNPLDSELMPSVAAQVEIHLDNLDSEHIGLVAETILGQPPSASLLELLIQRTDGNPFFVEQLVLYLQEQGLLTASGIPQTNVLVPTDVRAVLVARLDRLVQEVQEVVQTAAVLGREFEVRILSQMLSNRPDIDQQVARAEDEDIWIAIAQLRYLFKHALMRDAAYDMQLRARLRQLHQTAAAAFETIYQAELAPHYAEIAYHYDQAQVDEKAGRYFEQAGNYAKDNYHNEEAVSYLSRALVLKPADDTASRYQILLARQTIYDWLGQRDEQAADLSALHALAQSTGDAAQLAEAALQQVNYQQALGNYQEALHAAQAAIAYGAESGHTVDQARGRLSMGRTLWHQGEYQKARIELTQALELSRASGSRENEARCLSDLGIIDYYQADYDRAQANFQSAYTICHEIEDREREANCVYHFGAISYDLGDYPLAQKRFRQALDMYREIGGRYDEALVLGSLGSSYFELGDYHAAKSYQEQALTLSLEIGDREGEAISLDTLGLIYATLNEHEAARDLYLRALDIQQTIEDRRGEAYTLTHLGRSYNALGALEKAAEVLKQALEIRRQLDEGGLLIDSTAGLAETALAAGDLQQAANHVQEILSYIEDNGVEGIEFPIQTYLTCCQVLEAAGHDSRLILRAGYELLQERASHIQDEELRRRFLEQAPGNQALLALWEK